MNELVLSLFPGIDLLGRGFESRGFCVVRGPDLLWDQQIEDFRAVPGRFDGVVGGPPCQQYSDANRQRNTAAGDRLVLEFLRVVEESAPQWFLMENVRNVPTVQLGQYQMQRLDITDRECGGSQRRLRHIQFGSLDGSIIRPTRTDAARSVTARCVVCRPHGNQDRHSRRAAKQGAEWLRLRSLTAAARSRAIGNAVTLPVALALAEAVQRRSGVTEFDCICLCGREVSPPADHATAACRKRMERRRKGLVRILRPSMSHD